MTATVKQVKNWRQFVLFCFVFFFLHGLLKIPKNEEKTAENMKKENKNKRFIEMVSKSTKHGNMPKPRYWENIGPNSSRIPLFYWW